MGLKKNGQERNKLHLTISLPGSDDASCSHSTKDTAMSATAICMQPVVPAAEPLDESYMVMNSARTAAILSNIKNADHESTSQSDDVFA